MPICIDCEGLAYVGGANVYQCHVKGISLNQKEVEDRTTIECNKFVALRRHLKVSMKDNIEVGITSVFGNGSVQIPSEIRQALEIKDGDKILWIRKGLHEYTFRKVGAVPKFQAQFR